jgi:hypothetical protein
MNLDKTWSKKDLTEITAMYSLDIEEPKYLSKKCLYKAIIHSLSGDQEIQWNNEFPNINDNEDLMELLQKPKHNCELNYKDKQEMIQRAKYIIHYCRNGFLLGGSSFLSVEELYEEGLVIANHCNIPTCRRAINELNLDLKIRTKIQIKVSTKVKKDLEQKKINKSELTNKFKREHGIFIIYFD